MSLGMSIFRRMLKRLPLAFFGAALLLMGCGQRPAAPATVAADSTAVMQAYEQYRQAWLKGDTTAALARISDDIRILISGVPDIVGKSDARKLFVDEMAKYDVPVLNLAYQDVVVRGDHAIVIGRYEEVQAPKRGPPSQGTGRFLTIWRREQGQWRIARYMLNELPR
jgi:ketosteroid isomerase-like protein